MVDEKKRKETVNIEELFNKTKSAVSAKENDILQSDYLNSKIEEESKFNININSFLYKLTSENVDKINENTESDAKQIEENILSLIQKTVSSDNEYKEFITNRFFMQKEYDSMVSRIEYVKRALEVITSEILSPDEVNNKTYKVSRPLFRPGRHDMEFVSSKYKEIVERLKIDEELNSLTKWACKYGESYIEFKDYKEELREINILESESKIKSESERENLHLIENDHSIFIIDKRSFDSNKNGNRTNVDILKENFEIGLNDEDSARKSSGIDQVKNIYVKSHHPSTIVPIIIDDMILGFIKIHSSLLDDPNMSTYILNAISDLKENKKQKNHNLKNNNESTEIITQIRSLIEDNDLSISNRSAEEILILYNVLSKMQQGVYSTSSKEKTLIRFIPASRMEMLYVTPSSRYNRSVGASIFEDSIFKAKMAILYTTAINMARINNSIDSKLIKVEVGLPVDVSNQIEAVKQHLFRRVYSVDGFPNLDSIATLMTNMQHFIIPTKNREEFISIENLDNNVNFSDTVEDYKTIRDELVAGLKVPPAYLGLEENLESRSTLSHQSIQFGRTIVSYQNELSKGITKFIYKILYYLGAVDLVNEAEIKFYKPMWLKLDLYNEYLGKVSQYKQQLLDLGYSNEEVKTIIKDMLPDVDESSDKIDSLIDDITAPKTEEDEFGGGGFGSTTTTPPTTGGGFTF